MLKGSGIMREEDRKKCKNNKDVKESIYVSSSKIGLVFKLVIIALVFSSFLVVSVCFINKYNIDNILSINNYISYGDEEKEYYARLKDVYNEYNGEDKDFSELVITSTFTILQQNVQNFSFADMTKNRMREVADLMLDEVEHEDGSITYTAKGEEAAKESLAEYFKQFDSNLSDITCNRMANDVFDYIDSYLEFIGEEEDETSSSSCDGNSYWWPIGSAEVTTENGVTFASGDPVPSTITATFGGDDTVHNGNHGAIDISNGNGVGGTNIIAAKDGVVIYPTSEELTQFADNGYVGNPEGGGFGNYVVIQHSDGNYTYYAHMSQNSITVRAGDNVRQGQVIGKMGHSGSSTGTHLHFEVRVGGDAHVNRVDPLEYVSIDNPRPGCVDFSLTSTSLSKQEFISKMEAYCTNSGNGDFCTNFSSHAGEVYDVSLDSGVNPELVVVTAGTEQAWSKCGGLYNFWGIGIPNGAGCSAGPQLTSLAAGIREYASTLTEYQPGGSFASSIEQRNQEREEAGCDDAGHGPPGSLAGMQSVYSWIGNYRFSPGDWGMGGCVYLDIIYGSGYCSTQSVCTNYSNCPASSATTACEQNDYTAWQLQEKLELRNAIFGL